MEFPNVLRLGCLEFRTEGLRLRVKGLGFRVLGLGFRVKGLGFMTVYGLESLGYRHSGLGSYMLPPPGNSKPTSRIYGLQLRSTVLSK